MIDHASYVFREEQNTWMWKTGRKVYPIHNWIGSGQVKERENIP